MIVVSGEERVELQQNEERELAPGDVIRFSEEKFHYSIQIPELTGAIPKTGKRQLPGWMLESAAEGYSLTLAFTFGRWIN